MSGVNAPEDICNLALGHMGIVGSVMNITTGTNDKEIIFKLWYDICRQILLANIMPNFALTRDTVASIDGTPPFGYENMFQYPANCLKLLGIDDIDKKGDYPYAVENDGNGNTVILIDGSWDNGLPVRFIKDITNVPSMSNPFKFLLSFFLAAKTVMPITQSLEKKKLVESLMPAELSNVSGLNAQENPPVRKSTSRFREARLGYVRRNAEKK